MILIHGGHGTWESYKVQTAPFLRCIYLDVGIQTEITERSGHKNVKNVDLFITFIC